MYDKSLTRQSLPEERYRLLLGTALCVFSSNNGFIIENILRTDDSRSWYSLIDKESGQLKDDVDKIISRVAGKGIFDLFSEIVDMRNRIIHGFRITNNRGEQVLATKEKRSGRQFEIDEDYLLLFIRKNEELSYLLEKYREKSG